MDKKSIEHSSRPTISSEKDSGDFKTYLWNTLNNTISTIPRPANEDKISKPRRRLSKILPVDIKFRELQGVPELLILPLNRNKSERNKSERFYLPIARSILERLFGASPPASAAASFQVSAAASRKAL